jgi:hypothetical protein
MQIKPDIRLKELILLGGADAAPAGEEKLDVSICWR